MLRVFVMPEACVAFHIIVLSHQVAVLTVELC